MFHLSVSMFNATDNWDRGNTSEKGGTFGGGGVVSAALWERWNMVGTDACFWPALYRVCTFRRVWVKLVRRPIVSCLFTDALGKRLPKAHPTIAGEAPERPDRASTLWG